MEGSLNAKNQLDSSSRFYRLRPTIPACDERTDGQTNTRTDLSLSHGINYTQAYVDYF